MKRLVLVTAALFVAASGCSSVAPEPTPQDPNIVDQVGLPASAVQQISAIIAEKQARTPAQRKVSSDLLYRKNGRFKTMAARAGVELQSLATVDAQGRIMVDMKVRDQSAADLVALNGGTVLSAAPTHNSMRAMVPIDSVETLAASDQVVA